MTRPSGSARPIRLLQPANSLAWQPPPARPAREGPPPDPSVGVRPRRQPDPPLRVRRPTRLSGSSVCLPSVLPPPLLLIRHRASGHGVGVSSGPLPHSLSLSPQS